MSATFTTKTISGITTNSAIGGGYYNTNNTGSTITTTAYGVCWSTGTTPTTSNAHTINGSGSGQIFNWTSSLTGLTENTKYYVRAYLIYSGGTVYAASTNFTTLSIAPILITSGVTSVKTTSAICNCNVTYSGSSAVTFRGVLYDTGATPTWGISHSVFAGSGVGAYSCSLTNLIPDTKYYVRAFASNSQEIGFGNILNFTTFAKPTITTTVISLITQTTATGGGNVTSSGTSAVTARGICWSTGMTPTTGNTHTIQTGTTGAFTSFLTGLTPSIKYYVRAYAINNMGIAYGNTVNFKTLGKPSLTTLTIISLITQTTASGGGNVTNSGTPAATARGICWSTGATPTTGNTHTVQSGTTGAFTSTLTGLTPNTKYYIRAYAVNSIGITYGSAVSFRTLSIPAKISALNYRLFYRDSLAAKIEGIDQEEIDAMDTVIAEQKTVNEDNYHTPKHNPPPGYSWILQYNSSVAGYLNGVCFANDNVGWTVGFNSNSPEHIIILNTTDGGLNWTDQSSFAPVTYGKLQSVSCITNDTQHAWIVGYDNDNNILILYTANGGTSWVRQTSLVLAGELLDVKFTDTLHGWAVGVDGIGHSLNIVTSNGGTNWTRQAQTSSADLFSVDFYNTTHGWAVGSDLINNMVISAMTNGTTWGKENAPAPIAGILLSVKVAPNNALKIWAVGSGNSNQIIISTLNGGVQWLRQTSLPTISGILYGVSFVDSINGWAVGFCDTDNTITILNTNNGADWTSQTGLQYCPDVTYGALRDVYFPDVNHGWAVGCDGNNKMIIIKYESTPTLSVQTIPGTANYYSIDTTGGYNITNFNVVTAYGMQYSTNGGITWTTLLTPSQLTSSSYNTSITSLLTNTKYDYRAIIVSNGVEYYGNTLSITTLTYLPLILNVATTGATETITIPHKQTDDLGHPYVYNYHVDYGDGTPIYYVPSWSDAYCTHTYAIQGCYTIQISGTCESIYVNNGGTLKTYLTGVTSWGYVGLKLINFFGCTKLNSISTDTYGGLALITSFFNAFNSCALWSIPAGLFDHCINASSFESTFWNTTIGSIPDRLFDHCSLVSDFSYTFKDCFGLYPTIPTGLFDHNPQVTTFAGTFWACSITTLPTGLFDHNTKVTDFSNTFVSCENLTSIPTGLFNHCTKVTDFSQTFMNCFEIGSIPTGLFDHCTGVTTFANTFDDCYGINIIPTGLFDHCTGVTTFDHTFAFCSALTGITAGLFDHCLQVTTFARTFDDCTSLIGSAPALWSRIPEPTGTQCFYDDTGLDNYADALNAGWA